jgi:hypothetical protein
MMTWMRRSGIQNAKYRALKEKAIMVSQHLPQKQKFHTIFDYSPIDATLQAKSLMEARVPYRMLPEK